MKSFGTNAKCPYLQSILTRFFFFKLRFIIEKRICKHVLTVATKLIYVLLHSVKIDLLRAYLGLSCVHVKTKTKQKTSNFC